MAGQALVAVAARLDGPAASRLATKVLISLPKYSTSDRRIQPLVEGLTAACTKLDNYNAARVLADQDATPESNRAVLDALGMRLRMRFRNAWHFVDWANSNGIDVLATIKD